MAVTIVTAMTRRKAALTFGQRLRQLREAAGLSIPELAVKAGCTRQAIMYLETEHRKDPTWHLVCDLAAALDKTPNDFLG